MVDGRRRRSLGISSRRLRMSAALPTRSPKLQALKSRTYAPQTRSSKAETPHP